MMMRLIFRSQILLFNCQGKIIMIIIIMKDIVIGDVFGFMSDPIFLFLYFCYCRDQNTVNIKIL